MGIGSGGASPTLVPTDPAVIYDLLHEARNRLAGRYLELQGNDAEADPKIINFIGALDDRLEAVDINDTPTQLALIDELDHELRQLADRADLRNEGVVG